MLGTTSQVYATAVVRDVQACNGALNILLEGDLSATLAADHPDFDLLLRQAEASLRDRRPVAVALDAAGCLADLSPAHAVTIRWVKEDEEDRNRLAITVWEVGSLCYLMRDHPEFERLRGELAAAAASGARVLLATRTWPVEGEAEVWNVVLDARPAP